MIGIKSKAQSWSMDITIGVIVFIVAFFIVYSLLNPDQKAKASELKEEASTVIQQIASEEAPLRIVDNNEIKEERLNELKSLSYDELKRKLRVEGDFCIYIEDDKGNIVPIDSTHKGIGSSKIFIGDKPCS